MYVHFKIYKKYENERSHLGYFCVIPVILSILQKIWWVFRFELEGVIYAVKLVWLSLSESDWEWDS